MDFFLALLAALLGSGGMIMESHLVREKNPNAVKPAERLAFGALMNVVMLGAFLLFRPEELWLNPLLVTAVILLVVGVLDMFYNYLYLKALQKASASEVTPIVSLNPVFTLLISTFLPGFVNSPSIFLIVFLIIPGVYLTTLRKNAKSFFDPFKSPVFVMAILAALFTSVSAVLIDIALEHNYVSELTLLFVRMLIITALTFGIFRPALMPKKHKSLNWLLVLVIVEFMFVIERVAQVYAIGMGNVNLVVTIVSMSPVFVLLFDATFLKERVTLNKFLGTALVVVGVVIAALQI